MQCSELHFKKIYYIIYYIHILPVCFVYFDVLKYPNIFVANSNSCFAKFLGNKESIHLRKDPLLLVY